MILKKILIAVFSVLMFLPVAFFTPTMCYYAFNKEAVNNDITTTTTVTNTHEVPNYFPTNDIVDLNSIKNGCAYHYNGGLPISSYGQYQRSYDCVIVNIDREDFVFSIDTTARFTLYVWGNGEIDIKYPTSNGLQTISAANNIEFDIVCYNVEAGLGGFARLISYMSSSASVPNGTTTTVVDGTTTTTIEKENGVVESINQALEDTFELPVFNWATDNDTHSVLETVGSYMDIDSDNAVLSLLNYWLCVGGLFLVVYAVCLLPMYTLGFMDR